MKKLISVLLTAVVVMTTFTACSNNSTDDKVIKVGASVTPHAEILAVAKDILAQEGYTLDIIEFNDYILPNTATESGELDANYFQHQPYLDNFNKENGTHLVTIADLHYELFALYPGKTKSLEELQDGAIIAVPNDGTNEARALALLESQGLITLKPNAGLTATILDIESNPRNFVIQELDAALLALSLEDVDMAVINGNYAMQAGLKANTDAVALEDKESDLAKTFRNVLVVKEGNENNAAIQALKKAVTSDKVREAMETRYNGIVIPMF